ncbi:A-kinase anchor protein 5 [Dendrobates tinctorius]|uniref:A-kinase anchor protein 5 n=1 Tax=Dendrobates tinctorius TaxID=92724 RepID=UPI003CCA0AC4
MQHDLSDRHKQRQLGSNRDEGSNPITETCHLKATDLERKQSKRSSKVYNKKKQTLYIHRYYITFLVLCPYIKMSECKAISSDEPQSQLGQNDQVSKHFRGYSSMGFLRKGKNKRKPSRSNLCIKPKDFNDSDKKTVNMVAKKGEVLGLEEVSNEFTCTSSIMETYNLNANKETKFSFRKLEDGTFALETKSLSELNQDKSESGLIKRSSKKRHKKGQNSHKPLKICFKKRSKPLRKSLDSNEENKSDHKILACSTSQEDSSCVVDNHDKCSEEEQTKRKTWATLKSLVTRRRKLRSSVKRQSQLSGRHLETNTGNASIQRNSKKRRFSNMKLSCMNFSRGKRSSNNPLPSEDNLCTIKSSDTSGTDSGPDCDKSEKALVVKYKLQKSVDVENGKIGSSFDDGIQTKSEDIDKMCGQSNRISKNIQKIQEPTRPNLMENLSLSDDIQRVTESQRRNSGNSLKGCEGDVKVPPVSEITITIDSPSDVYEMLLASTATSLVNKVIESSIQKLIEEETFLNHVPSKDSERFYI